MCDPAKATVRSGTDARQPDSRTRTYTAFRRTGKEDGMQFQEVDEGNFRIHVGTMEGANGDGYIAAVVVSRIRGRQAGTRDLFRDDALAGGHRWARPDQALSYAIGKGRAVVHLEQRAVTPRASAL